MLYRRIIRLVLAAVVIPSLVIPVLRTVACAGEPTEQVRKTVDTLINILNDPDLKPADKKDMRREKLRKTIRENFHFDEMAKRSLGLHWKNRTPEERKEFVSLYTNLVENTYMRRIERYDGEKVLYTDERAEDSYALVKTQVLSPKRATIPIDYRIVKKGGSWSIYDITIEGVSLVNNYRTQFNQIIRNSSYEDLVKKLRDKTTQDPA